MSSPDSKLLICSEARRGRLQGRLVIGTLGDPYSNVALEEGLLREWTSPLLRVWENEESVVIGRAQLASAETDLSYCRSHGIPVVRRISAGGAVYNGKGNVNWSYFMPRNEVPGGPGRDAKGVFTSFASLVVEALGRCKVDARFEPPNRISDPRGKVSGMASYISRDVVLCHGTLLTGADLDLAARVTTPGSKEIGRRYPRSRPAEMSNCGANAKEFTRRLAEAGGHSFVDGELTDSEKEAMARLAPKYRSDEWNFGDPFP